MVVPFMSIYFHKVLGVPMRYVALLFLATAVVRSISGAIGGKLSDRIGRKPLLLLSPAARSISFFAVAYLVSQRAPFIPTAAVLVSTFFLAAAYQPVAQSVVADVIPEKRRLQAYAWTRVAMNLGWALGPALGGYISQVSYSLLFIMGGILGAITAVLVGLLIPETAPIKVDGDRRVADSEAPVSAAHSPTDGPERWNAFVSRFLEPLHNKRFLHYSVATLFMYLLMAQLVATLPVYAVETAGLRQDQLGHLYALNGLLVVLFQTTVTHALGRFPIVAIQALGSLAYGAIYFLFSQAWTFPAFLGLIFVLTFAEMAVTPGTVTVVSRLAPRESMGNYMGIFGLFSNSAWSLGPFIGGFLLDFFPDNGVALWGIVACLGLVACLLYSSFVLRFGDLRSH
jgi:MFS family permease